MGTQQMHPIVVRAIKHFGSQERMAKAIGSSQSAISRMLLMIIPISAEVAAAIDRETAGYIPRWQLRPDLWDAPVSGFAIDPHEARF